MRNSLILLTGAAGLVGSMLRHHWGDRFRLRLADIRPIKDLRPNEEYASFDVTEYAQFVRVCQGIHTVVHLAADAGSEDFHNSLLPRNVVGVYHAFEAAREAGCRRFIFASSIYAVRGHGPHVPITPDRPTHPQGLYGATKCWGEALVRVYADQHGLSCICVRLGNPRFDQAGDWDPDEPTYGISPRDTAQLFARCIETGRVDFAIVHGVSRHRRSWLDLAATRHLLGHAPQDGTAFPHQETSPAQERR